jgi:hypothetical protein
VTVAQQDVLYPKWQNIVVDSPTANVADFPFLLVLNDAKAIANADMASKRYRIYDWLGNLLSYEQESYTEGASYANALIWVKLPDAYASPTGDQNTVQVCYGYDPGSDQDDPTNAWDSYFDGVYHLPDGSTLSALDSTNHGYDGTVSGATAIAGKVGGGANFDHSDDFIYTGNVTRDYATAGAVTIEAWIKPAVASTTSYVMSILLHGSTTAYYPRVYLRYEGSLGKCYFDFSNNTAETAGSLSKAIAFNADEWHHIAAVWINGGTCDLYWDGVAQSAAKEGIGNLFAVSARPYRIGKFVDSDTRLWYGGMDEVRVSATGRSAAWLAYEHSNIADADNAQTWGGEETPSVGGPFPHYTRRLMQGGMIGMGIGG